jgi:ATP-dependent Clp protease ATP-binding subunit ClpC
VVLFDEIEKAHPEVWNSLLQILDDGRMTDGQGRTVDFRNTVIIMTSNLGTEFTRKGGALGFVRPGENAPAQIADHKKIEEELKRAFRPEFLNRVDEIIIFSTLSLEDVERIVDLQMNEIRGRLRDQGLFVELTEAARKWLAKQGFDPQFGARPLRRALQRYVESPLSVAMLKGEFKIGDTVLVDANEAGIVFGHAVKTEEAQPEMAGAESTPKPKPKEARRSPPAPPVAVGSDEVK